MESDVSQLRLNTSAGSSGNVTVTLAPSYVGATIAASVDVSDTRFDITTSSTQMTNAIGQAVFNVNVAILPLSVVPAGTYTVGSIVFSVGNPNVVVTVILQVQ